MDLKDELLKRIKETDDETLLSQVKALLDMHSTGRWDKLPESVKDAIIRGHEQSGKGIGTDHSTVL